MPDPEVIVVGGGPAGSSTAFFLARSGVDVLLLDRARFPRDKPCSEYLSPEASRILDSMGVLEEIESVGPAQLAGMRVVAPSGAVIHGEFAGARGFGPHSVRGLAVRRTIFDSILLDHARVAGVRVEEGARVVDLIRDSDGRVAGVRIMEQGQTREVRARLVVGADGLRSVVGRRLGLIRSAWWPRRIALVTHFSGVKGVSRYGEMHVERDGYCGLAPVDNDLVNFAIVVPVSRASEIAVDRTEFLESWIAERPVLADYFRHAERSDEVRATGPFATSARRAWAPGAALVGDAAEFFDPFTGEGIYSALRGAELLSEAALAMLRSASPAEEVRALRHYERKRRETFSGKWKVERLIGAAIAVPGIINRAAAVLSRRPDMADVLVGVVGDFVPAREVLRPGYLLPLLLAP